MELFVYVMIGIILAIAGLFVLLTRKMYARIEAIYHYASSLKVGEAVRIRNYENFEQTLYFLAVAPKNENRKGDYDMIVLTTDPSLPKRYKEANYVLPSDARLDSLVHLHLKNLVVPDSKQKPNN